VVIFRSSPATSVVIFWSRRPNPGGHLLIQPGDLGGDPLIQTTELSGHLLVQPGDLGGDLLV